MIESNNLHANRLHFIEITLKIRTTTYKRMLADDEQHQKSCSVTWLGELKGDQSFGENLIE